MKLNKKYKKNGFVIIENFLPKKLYQDLIKLFVNGKWEEIDQVIDDRYRLWETPNDKMFPTKDEIYNNHFWGSESISHHDIILQTYEYYIKSKIIEVLCEEIGMGRHQATKYENNQKDFLRVHYDDYTGYVGYVMHIQKETWKYDWGGLLQMVKDDEIKTILPQPNRLVVHDHSLGLPHWVTPVNSWAKENRYTLTGFCLKKNVKLPDTWRSRNDYSIF